MYATGRQTVPLLTKLLWETARFGRSDSDSGITSTALTGSNLNGTFTLVPRAALNCGFGQTGSDVLPTQIRRNADKPNRHKTLALMGAHTNRS